MAHLCGARCMKDYFLALGYNNSSSASGKTGSKGCTADKKGGNTTLVSNSKNMPVPCRQRAGGAALSIFQCTGETGTSGCLLCVPASSCTGPCVHMHVPPCLCPLPAFALPCGSRCPHWQLPAATRAGWRGSSSSLRGKELTL